MGTGERIYAGARLMLVAGFLFLPLLMELINWAGRGMLIDTVDLCAMRCLRIACLLRGEFKGSRPIEGLQIEHNEDKTLGKERFVRTERVWKGYVPLITILFKPILCPCPRNISRIQPPGRQKRGSENPSRARELYQCNVSVPLSNLEAAASPLSNSADKRCPASRKPPFRQPFPRPDAAFLVVEPRQPF